MKKLCAGITERSVLYSVVSDCALPTNEDEIPCRVEISMMSVLSDTHLTALITFAILERGILNEEGVNKK